MQLEWLKTFLLAAEHENFRVVAEKQFITQPAVTFQIKQLEKAVGAKLFNRSGRSVTMTAEGDIFLRHAEKLLKGYSDALQDLANHERGYRTTLTIATSPLVSTTQLTYILRQYMKEHPEVEIVLKVMESKAIERSVIDGLADVGFSRQKANLNITQQTIVTEDPVVMVIPSDTSAQEESFQLDIETIFNTYTLITHNHPEYWEGLLRDLHARFTFKTMVVSQVSTTKHFIEEGMGFSFLPHISVRREIAEGRILVIEDHPFDLPTTRTYLFKYRPTRAALSFEEFVINLMR
jgi:LysR family transcriptional regulator, repressor for citA